MKKLNKNFLVLKYLWILFFVFYFSSLNPEICFSTPFPKAWNLSDENLFFIGREEQLQKIHAFFNKGEKTIA